MMLMRSDAMVRHISLSVYALAAISRCVAHMVLEKPVPYGNATLNNSPLDANGLDFPCKQREGVYDVTQMNYWKVGETQTVEFGGSAVHGGGSCQFSITTDTRPTKASQWKVIHSVVGGCPATADGNLPGGEKPAATFEFVLPENMPSGRYTLAWTWFNRRGQREMYMNCAPILVSGGTDNPKFFDRLPDMFVANLPNTACATVEEFDFSFPLPGDSVKTGKQAKIATNLVGAGCESVTRLGAGAGTMRSPEADSQWLDSHSPLQPTVSQQLSSVTATVQVPEVKNAVSPKMSPMPIDTPTIFALTPDATTIASSVRLPTSPVCVVCETDGVVICIDDMHFGICSNRCAYAQALAKGTSCSGGVIVKHE